MKEWQFSYMTHPKAYSRKAELRVTIRQQAALAAQLVRTLNLQGIELVWLSP
jgi:hypothetical protein